MSRARFLWNFIKNPLQVGSVTPSSRWLCRRLVREAALNDCRCIVEFGPGTACLTREILAVLPARARLFAFEINEEFARMLQNELAGTRCIIVNDSAERVGEHLRRWGIGAADCIFSGLPFTAMPGRLRKKILLAAHEALKPGGKFIAYQYSLYLGRVLCSIFDDVRVGFELRNIPPAFCFVCTKKANG